MFLCCIVLPSSFDSKKCFALVTNQSASAMADELCTKLSFEKTRLLVAQKGILKKTHNAQIYGIHCCVFLVMNPYPRDLFY